jgi:hypothetical protein
MIGYSSLVAVAHLSSIVHRFVATPYLCLSVELPSMAVAAHE